MRQSRSRRPERAAVAACLLALGAALAPPAVAAQGEPEPDRRQDCCLLLLVPVGARASAIGGTLTARSGADAVFRNPAGLAGVGSNVFIVHHLDTNFASQIDAFTLLLRPFNGALAISYQLFDNGEIPTTDESGLLVGELALRDHLLVGSFATTLGGGLAGGISYKYYQQRMDCNGDCGGEESTGSTHAFDAGLRYSPGWHRPLELGIAVLNVGFPLQIVNAAQADPLPARVTVGVSYDVLGAVRNDSTLALRFLVDVRESIREPGDPTASFGAEFDVQRTVFLRAGYAPGRGLGTGAAVGVELRYDRFDVALSRSFVSAGMDPGGEPFQVSFGLHF